MPAQLDALQTAGIISDSPTFENSAPIENARLAFLGDVFAIPEGIPFANVFSVGDILLVLGAGFTMHVVSQSKLGLLFSRPADADDSDHADLGHHSDHADLAVAAGVAKDVVEPAAFSVGVENGHETSLAERNRKSMAVR